MRIGPRINQLCRHAHPIARALHTSLQYIRHPELLGDLANIAHRRILVLHHACATNYFQVGDFAEVGQNLIMDPICEKSVLLISTKILEWKYGYAFFWNRCRGTLLWYLGNVFCFPMKRNPDANRQREDRHY